MCLSCSGLPCVSAGSLTWADWGEWSTCSKSCGRGWQDRRRECVNSKTDDVKTALDCFGSSQEQRYCNDVPCPRESIAAYKRVYP